MSDSERHSTPIDKRSYAALWVLVVVAIVPLAAALVSYFGELALPQGKVNQGVLVLQQPPLSQWSLTTTDGVDWQGQGRWQLLLVVPECLQPCQQWRHLLGQIKTSLGRNRHRVQPQLVLPQLVPLQQQPTAIAASDTKATLLSPLAQQVAPGIWLADPLGNLVLHYRLDQPPQDLVKDLKRLLKLSKVG